MLQLAARLQLIDARERRESSPRAGYWLHATRTG